MKTVIVTVELTNNNYSSYVEKLPGCVAVGTSKPRKPQSDKIARAFHRLGEELRVISL